MVNGFSCQQKRLGLREISLNTNYPQGLSEYLRNDYSFLCKAAGKNNSIQLQKKVQNGWVAL